MEAPVEADSPAELVVVNGRLSGAAGRWPGR